MRDAFVRKLGEAAAEDPSVMLLVGDLGFGVVADFGLDTNPVACKEIRPFEKGVGNIGPP